MAVNSAMKPFETGGLWRSAGWAMFTQRPTMASAAHGRSKRGRRSTI